MKNTTVARVLPGSTASTESPSRSRVVERSRTSFCRFTHPSRDTMTTLSSSTMKSSAVNATSSSVSISVRRLSSLPPYSCLDLLDLVADDLPASFFVLEQAADLPRALPLVGQLVLDDENLETRQAVQLQLEDRIGLLGVETEALHDLLRRIRLPVRLADDPDDLVERVEDLLEALEDVDPLLQRRRARARGDW